MSVHENIIRVLNSPSTSHINFRYRSTAVYGSGFRRLARYVELDRIHVRLDSRQQVALLMRLTGGARYNVPSDTFFVPSTTFAAPHSLSEEALVIHEMTHALVDKNFANIRNVYAEGMAYVAQMKYLYLNGKDSEESFGRFLDSLGASPILGVFQLAWNIARVLRTEHGNTVDEASASALEEAILRISIYRRFANPDSMFRGNGISRRITE